MMNDDVVQGVENELAGCLRYDAIYKMISKVGVDLEVYIEIILQTQSFIFVSVLMSPPVYWSVGYMVYHSFLKGLVDTLPCSYRSTCYNFTRCYRVFRKNGVFSQFIATPPSPISL